VAQVNISRLATVSRYKTVTHTTQQWCRALHAVDRWCLIISAFLPAKRLLSWLHRGVDGVRWRRPRPKWKVIFCLSISAWCLAIYNNEFILDTACVGSEMINWIAINTIGNYCLSKSHMCYITSSSLQHVLEMPSNTNASSGRWRHSPTARSVTFSLLRAAYSLLMHNFCSSMYGFKINTTNVK